MAYTQRLLAYNSNKIEGSTLTEEQTASLFDNGTLPKSDDYYRAKAIGDYKQRPNMIGMYQTVRPENVTQEMFLLIDWYNNQNINISVLADFHARYENIHPFQDGNVTLRHQQKAA